MEQPSTQEQKSLQPIPVPNPDPNPAISSNLVPVVGPQYCLPYRADLALVRKLWAINMGNFTLSDINDNLLLNVKDKAVSLHNKRTILDPSGNPVVTIAEKLFSAHEKHFGFRGDSTDPKDLLFTVARSSVMQLKTTLNVFLANNTKQEVCDFKIKSSWSQRTGIVYAGETNTIVAEIHNKATFSSVMRGKEKFTLTVYPNIDYAFIVALIVILDDINGAGYCD